MRYLDVPYVRQDTDYRCAPAVLQMIFAYYGIEFTQDELATQLKTNDIYGTRHQEIVEVSRSHGMYLAVKNRATEDDLLLLLERKIPPVLHVLDQELRGDHYAVLRGISKTHFVFNDPWEGQNFMLPRKELCEYWNSDTLGNYPQWFMAVSPSPIPEGSFGKRYRPTASAVTGKVSVTTARRSLSGAS